VAQRRTPEHRHFAGHDAKCDDGEGLIFLHNLNLNRNLTRLSD
jgi:hypothetical protein